MLQLNQVFLAGNLTRDPEVRLTPGGMTVSKLTVATNRRYTNARQEVVDEVCYVDVDVWGKQAEFCRDYLRKGSPVFVDGRLRYDTWDDRATGAKRSRLTVTAERVQSLSQGPRGGDGGSAGGDAQPAASGERSQGYGGGRAAPSAGKQSMGSAGAPGREARATQSPRPAPAAAPPPPFPAGDEAAGPPPEDVFNVDDESIDDIPF